MYNIDEIKYRDIQLSNQKSNRSIFKVLTTSILEQDAIRILYVMDSTQHKCDNKHVITNKKHVNEKQIEKKKKKRKGKKAKQKILCWKTFLFKSKNTKYESRKTKGKKEWNEEEDKNDQATNA